MISWLTTDRSGVTTLIVALGILVGLIIVDVATGSRLQFNTVFGYSPTVAGRFAGLGNLGYAQLAAGAVLLAASSRSGSVAAAARSRDRADGRRDRDRRRAVLRSDVGGVLSMVPAYAVTATFLLGWHPLETVALYAAGRFALLAIFAAIDLSRPADQAHAPRRA